MEESLSELKCQEEIGFGQQFGCYQKMPSMETGHHLVKSTFLNPEVTQTALMDLTASVLLCIGVLIGLQMLGLKLMLITLMQPLWVTTSMIMSWNGMLTISSPVLMERLFSSSNMTRTCSQKVNSTPKSITLGKMKTSTPHLIKISIWSWTWLLAVQILISLMANVVNLGQMLILAQWTPSGITKPSGNPLGIS